MNFIHRLIAQFLCAVYLLIYGRWRGEFSTATYNNSNKLVELVTSNKDHSNYIIWWVDVNGDNNIG